MTPLIIIFTKRQTALVIFGLVIAGVTFNSLRMADIERMFHKAASVGGTEFSILSSVDYLFGPSTADNVTALSSMTNVNGSELLFLDHQSGSNQSPLQLPAGGTLYNIQTNATMKLTPSAEREETNKNMVTEENHHAITIRSDDDAQQQPEESPKMKNGKSDSPNNPSQTAVSAVMETHLSRPQMRVIHQNDSVAENPTQQEPQLPLLKHATKEKSPPPSEIGPNNNLPQENPRGQRSQPLVATTEEHQIRIAGNSNRSLYIALSTPNLWDYNNSTRLPDWLKEYFAWHQEQRSLMDETNWNNNNTQTPNFRFLISMAPRFRQSGGLTDRIRPLPAFLRLAAQTKRILMYFWDRPCPLEEFLVPPKGGMDWRVPSYMEDVVRKTSPHGSSFAPIQSAASEHQRRIVGAQYQSWHYGELFYNENLQANETNVFQVFRDIWKVVFTPTPPIARKIQDDFDRLRLIPGEFATAHIRALYAIKDRPLADIEKMARNALNCVSNLRPGGPFFVASDSMHAIRSAIAYGREHNVTVVAATNHNQTPLHIDRHDLHDDKTLTPAAFYDGFVDLYLMGASRCVAVGPGGFARWGHLLGFNETCVIHHAGRKSVKCNWNDGTTVLNPNDPVPGYRSDEERRRLQQESLVGAHTPTFHEPMPISER